MSMKSNTSSIFLLTVSLLLLTGISSVNAQKSVLDKANRSYANMDFKDAIHYYEKYLQSNAEIEAKRKLADCYIKTNNENKAIYLLENLVNSEEAKPEDFLAYANLLKKNRNYTEAKNWFQKYIESNPGDKLVNQLILSCNLITELKDEKFYNLKSAGINSPQSDFASAIYNNGLVFVSGRKNSTSKTISNATGEHYLDMYFAKRGERGLLTPASLDDDLNTKYHEGPACFTPNQRFIYFTRNKGNLNLQGKSELNIYTSRFNGKSWDKPELFQFSGQNYSMGHPSISADGRYLYFISNMEGGYGGTDIYVCFKKGFSWSFPINLGPSVNTNGNEMFPFMGADGYLYFASDGHIGFGGLDLYKTTFSQNSWTYPVNLGPPFNSDKDDFALLLSSDKQFGYFSSNRNGNDDIFEFEQNPEKTQVLKGRIIAKNNRKQLNDVQVILMENLSKEKEIKTDENGLFSFDIFKGKNYSLIVSKPGYKTKRILYFNQDRKEILNQLNITMESTQWVKLKGNIIDQYSGGAIEKANIEVINQTYKSNTFCESDAYGDFEADIDPGKSYDVLIHKKGYLSKVMNNYKYVSDKYEQIELQKVNKNDLFELYGVDFEPTSTSLSKNTIEELDNLVGLLKSNPNIMIEVIGHTETDRSKKENKLLSFQRAQNAFKYITKEGITANRVRYKGDGYSSERSALVVKIIEAF